MRSLQHPWFVYANPFHFLPLVRTYIEPGVDYWIDIPSGQARIRLTNIATGEYVIYGDLGKKAEEDYDVGFDEALCMNMPAGCIRVRVGEDPPEFEIVDIKDNLAYLGIENKWCLFVVEDMFGKLSYSYSRFNRAEEAVIRELQHAAIDGAPAHSRFVFE